MSLLQNIVRLNAEPVRNNGGAGVACTVRSSHNLDEQRMNAMFSMASVDQKSGIPNGYSPPYQWSMPIKDGGMSSYGGGIVGAGSVVPSLSMGKGCSATITGTGEISISSLLTLLLPLLASITGSGTLTPSMVGKANLIAELVGQGSITAALDGLAWMIAGLAGVGSITADLRGKMSMSAELTGAAGIVTAASCAEAVWSALASQFNITDTMGEMLNSTSTQTTAEIIQVIVNAIKAKTDLLPSDVTSKSDLETTHGLGKWESGIEFIEET